MAGAISIRRLDDIGDREVRELSDVLIDCVAGGASVSFMWPMTREKAEQFWHQAKASAQRGERAIFAAEETDGTIIGTVQVIWAQPENQPHRADIAKMLVHRRGRRRLPSSLGSARERRRSDRDYSARAGCQRLRMVPGWQSCRVHGSRPDR